MSGIGCPTQSVPVKITITSDKLETAEGEILVSIKTFSGVVIAEKSEEDGFLVT